MKICVVQADLAWQDRKTNLSQLEKDINGISETPDLIVLPEMFTTGFTMEPERFAEPPGGEGLSWMRSMAKRSDSVLCASIAIEENGKYFNRLYWVRPDGTFSHYDKRHLFRMGNEHDHYSAGQKKLIIPHKGWNICPLVCYDLRFPVWSRCRHKKSGLSGLEYEYDILVYVANWPAVRAHAWKQLLIARAIENQCYVVGVNRCGKDGNGVDHSGGTMIVGPLGEVVLSCDESPQIRCTALDKQMLVEFRRRFPAGLDADDFDLSV